MKITELREDFIRYFRENKHKLLRPSKVFNDDPSLLFVNAGMNQLKTVFLNGDDERPDEFRKLCNSQICIRAGGKHNDLDDVGLDSYHLTSFEMLGNWSIDSYRKEEAIRLAYTYLTEHLNLDKNKIYVTYFEGDESEGLSSDEETKEIWKRYVTEDRIVKGNFKDNFWMMADEGPCGMSTEIHYDLSEDDRLVPDLVNRDDPTLIEIWNIVFIEYKRDSNCQYEKLGRFYVDTGMGLERLCMVLQKKETIYQTDAFHYLMGYGRAISNCAEPYSDCYDKDDTERYYRDCAYRILCDHFRTVVVALFDGAEFDITGRGFVLRKIMRRMLTYTYLYLNDYTIEPLLSKPLVKGIVSDILNYHNYRKHDYDQIHELLVQEERLFLGKLWNSKRKLQTLIDKMNNNSDSRIQTDTDSDANRDTINKLKMDGIPEQIIDNIDRVTIKKFH